MIEGHGAGGNVPADAGQRPEPSALYDLVAAGVNEGRLMVRVNPRTGEVRFCPTIPHQRLSIA